MLFTDQQHQNFAKDPAVVFFKGAYFLYYSLKYIDGKFGIGIAWSNDLENWKLCGEIPLEESYEKNGIAAPGAIVLENEVHLFYQTYGNWQHDAICHAVSNDGVHFLKNIENPVFSPQGDWCCGRAIDADVCVFQGKLNLFFATRDYEMKIQKVGGAWAELKSGFGKNAWTMLAEQSLLYPELLWEGECIEAPATIEYEEKLYMFYGGSYNCTPQQIGCAVSEDGVFFKRICEKPFLPCGKQNTWNSSESGHPYVFQNHDGRVYLFYQGSADEGETWYLSKEEISFVDGKPIIRRNK